MSDKPQAEHESFLMDELQEQNAILLDMVTKLKTQVEEGDIQVQRDEIADKLNVLYDPYDASNPYSIIGTIAPEPEKGFPQGQVLSWKYPRYRQIRGWRGWVPVVWDDEYCGKDGELLSNYIPDPPQRMGYQEHDDSYVRRGDLILCRLDKRIFVSRGLKMELESARQRGSLRDHEDEILSAGVKLVGAGMATDATPKKFSQKSAHPDEGTHRTALPFNPTKE